MSENRGILRPASASQAALLRGLERSVKISDGPNFSVSKGTGAFSGEESKKEQQSYLEEVHLILGTCLFWLRYCIVDALTLRRQRPLQKPLIFRHFYKVEA